MGKLRPSCGAVFWRDQASDRRFNCRVSPITRACIRGRSGVLSTDSPRPYRKPVVQLVKRVLADEGQVLGVAMKPQQMGWVGEIGPMLFFLGLGTLHRAPSNVRTKTTTVCGSPSAGKHQQAAPASPSGDEHHLYHRVRGKLAHNILNKNREKGVCVCVCVGGGGGAGERIPSLQFFSATKPFSNKILPFCPLLCPPFSVCPPPPPHPPPKAE